MDLPIAGLAMLHQTQLTPGLLHLEPDTLKAAYDREPMGFDHGLHTLPLFQRDALERLASAFAGHRADYFVAGSARTPGMAFYDVPTVETTPAQALAGLDSTPTRVLLKRPENHDPAFRSLLEQLFNEVARTHGGLQRSDVIRLESAILITSAASTTPFHFDPEVGFFSQIEGQKTYHVYAPATLSEQELESFYRIGKIDIGQVDISGRAEARDYAFDLQPGRGLHQPQNAPHWVQTHGTRSVSYTFVFETRQARLRSRARGFNHYIRQLGIPPAAPGQHPGMDAVKGRAMQVMSRMRKVLTRS
jgi:hypothetical protein